MVRIPLILALSLALLHAGDDFYKEPAWKPRALLPAEDALRGDFWPASPPSGATYDDPGFDASRLSPPPPPGVHPRVVVTPADVDRIREKVALGDKAPPAFRSLWERFKKNRSAFYAHVANDDALGKTLASELVKKMTSLEPKLDKLDALPDRDNLWNAERSIIASGDPDPPTEIWALIDYDYLHRWMSPAEREQAERLIARITSGRISNFLTYPDHFMINNHQGFGMEFVRLLLLIEGQKGFDERVYKLAAKKARAMLDWYLSKDGMCYESIKGWLNMPAFVAIARREPDLLRHSHLRAKMDFFAHAIRWEDGRWQIREEMRASAFHVIWAMHFFHPKDPLIDWLYAATFSTHDFLSDPNAKWPNPVGTNEELLLLFAEDGAKGADGKPLDWTSQAQLDTLKRPLTWKDDQRGYVIARNSSKKDDLQVGFTTKQDFYYGGHEGSENNRIVLWADGVNWLRDSNMLAVKATFLQNMVTIDGKGVDWPPAPGVWLGVTESPEGVAASGDGKLGYSFAKVMQVHPLDSPSLKTGYYAPFGEKNFDLTRDLQVAFHPGTVKWDDGYAHTDYGPWSGETRLVEHYRTFNPVEKAYRTVYLARGEHPYVLVLDDVNKDGKPHLYEWNATLPEGIDLADMKSSEILFQSVPPGPKRATDLLLCTSQTPRDERTGKRTPKDGDPLLLIRTLWRNSDYGFPVPRFEKVNVEPQAPYTSLSHITIPAVSSSPEFRILLYPHRDGDPLPVTEWSEDRSRLSVKIGDVEDVYHFGETDGGRTVFSVERNGRQVFQSQAPPPRPILEVRGKRFDANALRTTRDEGKVPEFVFDRDVSVKIPRPSKPAYVVYTLDGSEPTADSPRYDAPIRISKSLTLAARTIDPGWTAGEKEGEVIRAKFLQTPASKGASSPPSHSIPGLLARVYEKKTVMWDDRGFFDAEKIMLPDLDKESPTAASVTPGFELPFVTPSRPQPEQAKGFYRFNGWYHATRRGVHEFLVDSCGPVVLNVGGQAAISAKGIYHQQQALRQGAAVLAEGWHPLELIVTDPLLWNLSTTGEMPFSVRVAVDGGAPESIPGDLLACLPPAGLNLTQPPPLVWRNALPAPAWHEPGFILSTFERPSLREKADYLDVDTSQPSEIRQVAEMEPNSRPSLVRSYDAWFYAPEEGVYEFDLAARKPENSGLGDLRSAFQNQLRIGEDVVVQHGTPGRRAPGRIGLRQGWHPISIRLGASPPMGSVTYPDGESVPLSGVEFHRPSAVNIRVGEASVEASVREIYGPSPLTFSLPPGRKGTIRYTLDGTEPTPQSPEAKPGIVLDKSAIVTAAAFLPDGTVAGRNRVDARLVKVPESRLISSARFSEWDGKTGTTQLDAKSSIWLSPTSQRTEGPAGSAVSVNRSTDEAGLPRVVDVNVMRELPRAGARVTDLAMRDSAVTVGVWFKSDSAHGQLFGKDGRNAFGKAYQTISCELNKGKLTALRTVSGGRVNPGEWTHVVLTADPKAVRLYVNGVQAAEGEGTPNIITDALDFFTDHSAEIEEIRIYDRVLSPEDIRSWHDSLKRRQGR